MPREEATGFGVMQVDENDRIVAFLEKPKDPPRMPGKPDVALASMGIYVFETQLPVRPAAPGRGRPEFGHDFGKDIIPYLVKHGKAVAHRFSQLLRQIEAEAEAYWRDVGTVDAYWEANMDLTDVVPGARPL